MERPTRKELEIHLQASGRRFREFGAISRTYQNPPCLKPWAIAQAFFSKTANFRPSRIHPESIQTVPQGVRKHLQESRRRFREFGAISRTYQNPPCLKPWAIAQAFFSKTANFRPSRIHPESTQTVPQGVRKHLQESRRRFREFGAISRTYQNPPCLKPWAIAQAFFSKTANFRPSRIHPESTQTVPQGVRNSFASIWEAFQRV